MFSAVKTFGNICRRHRILLHPNDRKIGISSTLIGWALIALGTVFFQNSVDAIPFELNFFIQFFVASIVLLIASRFKGSAFLRVKKNVGVESETRSFLTPKQRVCFLYVRGGIAVIGYIAYSIAAVYTRIIDNSAIFSADAIVYLVLMWLLVKEKVRPLQILSVIVATIGIFFIFFTDINFLGYWNGILGVFFGLFASVALAIIILMGSIMVQHDPPLKIATYQCVIGAVIAFFIVMIGLLSHTIHFNFPVTEVVYSTCTGLFYAISLLFFFNALIYTEPLTIAILGYSLTPFIFFFNWSLDHEIISLKNLLSTLLICIGGGIAIFSSYRGDRNLRATFHRPLHRLSLLGEMDQLVKKFKEKKMNFYQYMSSIHEFNKLLFGFSKRINQSDINKIEIKKDGVYFSMIPDNIKMLSDGACRSAPLEILNFGEYESEESIFIYKMINDGDVVFDIGSHIGWYTINFAKKFPSAFVYGFEPVPTTFEFLKKNVKLNHIKNVNVYNYGLSEKNETIPFHYFPGGSALASPKNLINHKKTELVQCCLKCLDDEMHSYNIKKLDFMKIDVEGCELKVLKGGIKSIKKFRPIIYIELYDPWCKKFGYAANDAMKLLCELGYKCYSAENARLVEQDTIIEDDLNYNYFFLHTVKHKKLI
jgi:FkbM family methyltransferase